MRELLWHEVLHLLMLLLHLLGPVIHEWHLVLWALDIQSGLGLGLLLHNLSSVIVVLVHLRRLGLVERDPHKVNLDLGLRLLLLIRVSLIVLLRIVVCRVHHANRHLVWLHNTSRGLWLLKRLLVLSKSLHYLSGWASEVHVRRCSRELLRAVTISLSCSLLKRILVIRLLDLLILEPIRWTNNWRICLKVLIWRVRCRRIRFVFGCLAVTHHPVTFTAICLLLVGALTHCVIIVKLIIKLLVLNLKILELLINYIRSHVVYHVLCLLSIVKLALRDNLLLLIL